MAETWVQPHWSGRPQPGSERQARLKPNLFARLARFAALNRVAVLVAVLFVAAFAAGFAALTLEFAPDRRPRIVLDRQTESAQAALERSFPGIDRSFIAVIENRNAAHALAAALAQRPDLFAAAFVPGTDPFYAKYRMLFRDAADIEARVARFLRMQPLFVALAAAPDVAGLSALVREIANAVAQGRSPPGLAEVLVAAAAAVEGEVGGKAQPVDWPRLAGLVVDSDSTRWFVVATPAAGREREAAAFAVAAAGVGSGATWHLPPQVRVGSADLLREQIVPALMAVAALLAILGVGVGAVRFALPVIATAAAALALTAGIASLIASPLDAVTWTFPAAVLAPALLFAIVMTLAHVQARRRGREPLAALMLAAQRQGPLAATLAIVSALFWLTWLPRQLPSLGLLAAVAAAGIAASLLLSLVAVPAVLAAVDRDDAIYGHWLDGAAARPVGRSLRNGRYLAALVFVAAASFCAVFVPGLRFSDVAQPAGPASRFDPPLAAGAVHVLAASEAEARRHVEELARRPETGALRWAGQLLPVDPQRKLDTLRQLAGIMPVPAARRSFEETVLAGTFAALAADLSDISASPVAAADLREAAHRLRRALVLLAGEAPAQEGVAGLEEALFAGLGELAATADRLAALAAPGFADLDPALRQRFLAADGTWRIEVLPKPEIKQLSFAAAMRRYSATAAGEPVVALARNEIIHHETGLAVALAAAAAAAVLFLFLWSILDLLLALFPLACTVSLSAAAFAVAGQAVTTSALAAAMPAFALCLATSVVLVLRGRKLDDAGRRSDTSLRAALLAPAIFAATVAPLALSGNPAVAGFGFAASLFLGLGIAANLVIVPQAAAWLAVLRRSGEGPEIE